MKNLIKNTIFLIVFVQITFAQTTDIQIEGAVNIAELLCFQPHTHDISGETAVRVKLSENIKKKIARYNWTIGNYGIKLLNPKQESVIIQAVNPGLSSVKYEALDKKNVSLGKVEIPLSVPQFVHIFEDNNYDLVRNALPKGIDTSKAREFDEVLKYARLLAFKKEIYKEANKAASNLLSSTNVRLIWDNLGQKLPKSLNSKKVTRVHIGGFAQEYFINSSHNKSIGLGYTGGHWAFVTMGRITDAFTIFALNNMEPEMRGFEEIMIFLKDKTIPESRKNLVILFWKEVFAKIFGFATAHEIGHTLGLKHTDITKYPDDMMTAKYDNLDIGLTKKEKIDWRTFPLPGTYKWVPMKGLNEHNLAEIQKILPVTSDLKFKPFFSLEN